MWCAVRAVLAGLVGAAVMEMWAARRRERERPAERLDVRGAVPMGGGRR